MQHIVIRDEDPLVSIVVPVYNGERYIGQTLDSLVRQVLQDIEIIIVNDGSTDRTKDVCKHFFFDRRIRYVEKDNGGTGSALNLGHSMARGKYATWCSADNVYTSQFAMILSAALSQCMKAETPRPIEFVYSDFGYIDAEGRRIARDVVHKHTQPSHDLVNGYDLGMSFMYTMDLWRKTGLFWDRICEDYHWVVRAAEHTEFALIRQILAFFRVHENQITGSNKEEEKAAADECKRIAAQMLQSGKYGNTKVEEHIAGQFKPTLVEG